jgi:hypothetical protein
MPCNRKGGHHTLCLNHFLTLFFSIAFLSERNREHAKRSRLRKKGITAQLQESVIQLKEENEKLRSMIYAKIDKTKTDAMVNAKSITPTDKFLKALQKPSNRIVDHSTLSFLQSLSASCQIGK